MEWLLVWLVCALIASAIGSKKGEPFSGFLFGAVLGPLGVLLALLSSGNRKPCPACREKIHKKATVCPHCRTAL
jgi:hypothetical protein